MISGEKFQSLSQISLYNCMSPIMLQQIKSMSQNMVKISDMPAEEIKKYKVIYVYTHSLNEFFKKYYSYLNEDTILISHNSDDPVDETYLNFLSDTKIKAWFCQNRTVSHNKLISLPIGAANSQWPHGNQDLIYKIRHEKNEKRFLVYKNFDIGTNVNERSICNQITTEQGIPLSSKTSIEEYWRTISQSVFVISPPGNGIDCHRIWETLFLGATPVVRYHEAFSQFTHLPILFIEDWGEVTISFLREKVDKYKQSNYNIPELYVEFWANQISKL